MQRQLLVVATLIALNRGSRHWKLASMLAMLRAHLRLTTREAVARLQSNWAIPVTQ
jgi:hypothetical protein